MIDWGVKEGARLKELRMKKGFTVPYVAKKIECGQSSMFRWEAGICAPRMHFLKDLAFLYNVSIEDVIGGESAPVANLPYIEPKQNIDFEESMRRASELITPVARLNRKTKDLLEMMAKLTGKGEDEMLDIAVQEYAKNGFDWNMAIREFCNE